MVNLSKVQACKDLITLGRHDAIVHHQITEVTQDTTLTEKHSH